ncbi:MAG: sensor histidine kinase [Patiriisocius sp.]|uniref:sensor histidine kinase n=1 Tax=Patiriisocius sp. TaxID=2822396 RepID=UPI003EF18D9A
MENQQEIVNALIYGILFTVFLMTGLMLFFYFSRKKILQKEMEKIGLQIKFKDQLLESTIATQEEERQRIAQDLHDAISAKLNVVSLTAHMMLDSTTLSNGDRASLEHVLKVTTSTLESSRRISHDLLPPVLDKFGLKVALEELFEDFKKTNAFQMLYSISINGLQLTKTQELHVFRIVQELINNATRHGKATQIKFSITQAPHGFQLTFEDNGTGFSMDRLEEKIGLGMQNIKSRAAILRCSINIESSVGKGTSFIIASEIPETEK